MCEIRVFETEVKLVSNFDCIIVQMTEIPNHGRINIGHIVFTLQELWKLGSYGSFAVVVVIPFAVCFCWSFLPYHFVIFSILSSHGHRMTAVEPGIILLQNRKKKQEKKSLNGHFPNVSLYFLQEEISFL